jgi:hypothetical protein
MDRPGSSHSALTHKTAVMADWGCVSPHAKKLHGQLMALNFIVSKLRACFYIGERKNQQMNTIHLSEYVQLIKDDPRIFLPVCKLTTNTLFTFHGMYSSFIELMYEFMMTARQINVKRPDRNYGVREACVCIVNLIDIQRELVTQNKSPSLHEMVFHLSPAVSLHDITPSGKHACHSWGQLFYLYLPGIVERLNYETRRLVWGDIGDNYYEI